MRSKYFLLILLIFIVLIGAFNVELITAKTINSFAKNNISQNTEFQSDGTPSPINETTPTSTLVATKRQQVRTSTAAPSPTKIYIPPQLETKTVRSLIWLAFLLVGLIGLGLWRGRQNNI